MIEHHHSPQCRRLLGSLSEYIDGELQSELCAALETHLKDCDNCRIVVNTLLKTVELYRQTAEEADLPGPVRERLFHKLNLEDYLNKPGKTASIK